VSVDQALCAAGLRRAGLRRAGWRVALRIHLQSRGSRVFFNQRHDGRGEAVQTLAVWFTEISTGPTRHVHPNHNRPTFKPAQRSARRRRPPACQRAGKCNGELYGVAARTQQIGSSERNSTRCYIAPDPTGRAKDAGLSAPTLSLKHHITHHPACTTNTYSLRSTDNGNVNTNDLVSGVIFSHL